MSKIRIFIFGIIGIIIAGLLWYWAPWRTLLYYQETERQLRDSWKTYTDPNGFYSFSIPSTWEKESSTNNQMIVGAPSSTPGDSQSYYIDISVQQYPVSSKCLEKTDISKTTSGFPIDNYNSFWHTRSVYTDTFTWDIAYEYTGNDWYISHPANFKPVNEPQSFLDENQKIINKVMASFTPLNQKPFPCIK
jgi:hypothetical protein